MCGIAGGVAWDDRFHLDSPTLGRMAGRLAHRGPDGQDIWLSHENSASANQPQCGLAFCRLAILDLDRRAMQPMTDGQCWLVFNGEIYNFRLLRQEIDRQRPGYSWKTSGDSEVILRAYDCWGRSCLEHFNGMFALAIWDPHRQELFLARDRMGQKPLYFALAPDAQAVVFASELSALKEIGWIGRQLDAANVVEYFRRGYVPRGSIYRQIDSLRPGECATIAKGIRRDRYFDPNQGTETAAANAHAARELLERAVSRQLVADVPVGCFLSGGIDSSIIAAAMKRAAGQQPVLTFSIGFDDPRYDETSYAAEVARHLHTDHRQFIVRPEAAEDLPKLAQVFGEPFGDSSALPTHYLARETRAFVKVALSGDGGDELFGGYDRYRAAALAAKLDRLPGLPAILKKPLWRWISGQHPKSRSARAKRFAQSLAFSPAQRYAAYVGLFDDAMIAELIGDEFVGQLISLPDALAAEYQELLTDRDEVAAACALDRVSYLPGDLLTKVDRASMLHNLEVRSPFMDHELVRFAAGLDQHQLLSGGPKRLLRQAYAADLPDFVFRRRKMGFAVPIGDWLRTSLREMLSDLLFSAGSFANQHLNAKVIRRLIADHESLRADHSQRLYALLMLELWWKDR